MTGSPVEGRFLERVNRFRIRVALGARLVDAHLPNPGRLRELLAPRAAVRLMAIPTRNRSTRYDALAVRRGGAWVCLDTRLANAAVADALRAHAVPELRQYREVRTEVRWQDSRFDFLLENPGRCWLEVKSCSLVEGGCALFPDAPTSRGTKHLNHLAVIARRGTHAAVMFVVVRRAERFSPNDAADPAFGTALREAATAGVDVLARRGFLRGTRLELGGSIPIVL